MVCPRACKKLYNYKYESLFTNSSLARCLNFLSILQQMLIFRKIVLSCLNALKSYLRDDYDLL